MMNFCKILILMIATIGLSSAAAEQFGKPVDNTNRLKISTIMAAPDNYLDQPITIEGTVVGVCAKRGCWMTIASDKRFENLQIKVNDGDMVFPMTAKGSKAIATGKLNKIQLNLDRTKALLAHRAQQAGNEFDENTVTEPMAIYQLVPTGVEILE
ncbi:MULTISPECIES: DUF4920 domain-containing protein [unclassified Pseudoalteromonas]|uniref:DUF4920 domain-containing protein n=1 Tax=unclassified Pseudoalteromonas TaxID=194690 RepID=UPI001FCBD1F1|nr:MULTISPECIES: DUF4920 domain-containing protein [unclassified Pseudoalteromonas]